MAHGGDDEELGTMIPWVYDLILWTMSILTDLFFREIHPRGSWRIPRRGPVLFVAAPHANQFVDSLVLMRVLRTEAHRRVSNIIAAASMKRRFVGAMAGAMGSIAVSRAMDLVKPGSGKVYMPDPVNDPLLVRGVGTDFEKQAQKGGLLVLPSRNGVKANTEILEITGPEELRLKKEFKEADALLQLTGKDEASKGEQGGIDAGFEGTKYKLAPKIDQTKVYDAVFHRLESGGCVCIFPEGGSHDRTELLPLKAGVAIMALGSLAANPDSGLKIVCCGMNYFHAHKFRSRAVVEFSSPMDVPKELVDMYRSGERREATRQLLEMIYNTLLSVTVTSPDYETLQLIQAVRRLYKPKGKKLPLPMIVELNRRLVKGYQQYKDDPRFADLKTAVIKYNKQLRLLGIRDHQVEYASFSMPAVVFTLFYRLGKLLLLTIGTVPGLVLFAPIFIASKLISIKKAREALAASSVKVAARDVLATWKLLVAQALAPLLYTFYAVLLTYWTWRNRVQGYMPDWVPLWLVPVMGYIIFPIITFAALRIGEIGMDILKSIRPLVLSLNPSSSNTFVRLRETREQLSAQVTEMINTLGPEMFDDFDHTRLVADPLRDSTPSAEDQQQQRSRPQTPSKSPTSPFFSGGFPPLRRSFTDGQVPSSSSTGKDNISSHNNLPRNESFGNLGNFGLFSTRPPSRGGGSSGDGDSSSNRSRSNSRGAESSGLKGLSSSGGGISARETLEEVSKKIRGAMQERAAAKQRRVRKGSEASWEFAGDGEGEEGGEGESAIETEAEAGAEGDGGLVMKDEGKKGI